MSTQSVAFAIRAKGETPIVSLRVWRTFAFWGVSWISSCFMWSSGVCIFSFFRCLHVLCMHVRLICVSVTYIVGYWLLDFI